MTIGEKLKNLLLIKGITITQLAKLLGVKPQTVNSYFSQEDMGLKQLKKICKVIGEPINTFIDEETSSKEYVLENGEATILQDPAIEYGISKDEIIRVQKQKIERLEARLKSLEQA